jgi:hypothetical protein
MKGNTLLFIGFLFFDVAALAWGAWEVWSARETKRGSGDAPETARVEAPAATSPGLSGHPEG